MDPSSSKKGPPKSKWSIDEGKVKAEIIDDYVEIDPNPNPYKISGWAPPLGPRKVPEGDPSRKFFGLDDEPSQIDPSNNEPSYSDTRLIEASPSTPRQRQKRPSRSAELKYIRDEQQQRDRENYELRRREQRYENIQKRHQYEDQLMKQRALREIPTIQTGIMTPGYSPRYVALGPPDRSDERRAKWRAAQSAAMRAADLSDELMVPTQKASRRSTPDVEAGPHPHADVDSRVPSASSSAVAGSAAGRPSDSWISGEPAADISHEYDQRLRR